MNKGMRPDELIEEVKRQRSAKRDFMVPNTHMVADYTAGNESGSKNDIVLTLNTEGGKEEFLVGSNGHQQLSTYLGIPMEFYKTLRHDLPDLLTTNINRLLENDPEGGRFVRVLDDQVRAVLSPSYQRRDNDALAIMALQMIQEQGALIRSANIDPNKLYIKATLPNMTLPDPGPRRVGQVIEAGITVSNSEVGLGSVRVEPMAYLLACLNGMIGAHALRKYHVGRRRDVSEAAEELFSEETKALEEEAFWMQVRDILNSSFDEVLFGKIVASMSDAAEADIPKSASLQGIVEKTVKDHGLPVGLNDNILNTFIAEGDLTKYGLVQAVTNVANNQENYEVSTKLERTGGKILEMKEREWESLLTAEPKKTH